MNQRLEKTADGGDKNRIRANLSAWEMKEASIKALADARRIRSGYQQPFFFATSQAALAEQWEGQESAALPEQREDLKSTESLRYQRKL